MAEVLPFECEFEADCQKEPDYECNCTHCELHPRYWEERAKYLEEQRNDLKKTVGILMEELGKDRCKKLGIAWCKRFH